MIFEIQKKRKEVELGQKIVVKALEDSLSVWKWRILLFKEGGRLGLIIGRKKATLKYDWIGFLGQLNGWWII